MWFSQIQVLCSSLNTLNIYFSHALQGDREWEVQALITVYSSSHKNISIHRVQSFVKWRHHQGDISPWPLGRKLSQIHYKNILLLFLLVATNSTSLPAPSQFLQNIHSGWIKVVHTVAHDGADVVGLAQLQDLPPCVVGVAAEQVKCRAAPLPNPTYLCFTYIVATSQVNIALFWNYYGGRKKCQICS